MGTDNRISVWGFILIFLKKKSILLPTTAVNLSFILSLYYLLIYYSLIFLSNAVKYRAPKIDHLNMKGQNII
jgi:hypothetical protein